MSDQSERTDADAAWEAFIAASRAFANYLDQWEKVKFQTPYGMVYVSIGRADLHPDDFQEITNG